MTTELTLPVAPFSADVEHEPRYDSAATLADDPAGLTCSVTVGMRWGAQGKCRRLLGYPSFELAAETVKSGRHDALLVAGAYPEIRSFFFDPELRAVEAFVSPLPDMVFAAPLEHASQERFDTVHYHPATTRLFESSVRGRTEHALTASSNSAACRSALEDSGRSAAITNQTCADHYGLKTLEVLSVGTPMSFVVFERRVRQP
ncbi:hypothetical protein V2S66_33355 [Streptomyces sp. V4-01]|uniref:Bacilysin biosynthesis protein BacA n=1 Tax=Actinacidiphila polyblastidii TaxID=3110430 RepID=A0ABU7PLY2_9ACTN|nr:hypothetical protein [Streptomyces sp. V4-01]